MYTAVWLFNLVCIFTSVRILTEYYGVLSDPGIALSSRIPLGSSSCFDSSKLLKHSPYLLVEQERMANAQLLMYGSKHLEPKFFFFFYFLYSKYFGAAEYPVVLSYFYEKSLQILKVPPNQIATRTGLLSACSMYYWYWCGWSRFTVNTLLKDFQSQNGVTEHPGGVRQHRAGHHNLAHCSLLKRQAVTRHHAAYMQHTSSCISIMHQSFHESCQEFRVFGVCLLFWDPNPISNRTARTLELKSLNFIHFWKSPTCTVYILYNWVLIW
jgi:hypothetical protein